VYSLNQDYSNSTKIWTTGTSYTPPSNLTSGTYYWKVEAQTLIDRPPIVPDAPASVNDSREGDEETLRLYAESLGVANWYDNTGWSDSSMSLSDTIYGVTVELVDSELRVTEIDLMANNLVGQIPEFPGLQNCWKMRWKQIEANTDGREMSPRITGSIPDSIGNNTVVTHLSLSGRRDGDGNPLDIFTQADDDEGDYNMKRGIAANQFTGGIPDSLYNLVLRRLEIDGQNSQFNGQLQAGCGNWDITHIYATGNDFYESGESAFFGSMSNQTKSWVNCIRFGFQRNVGVTDWPIDMFEGWNDLPERVVSIDGTHRQSFPDMSNLSLSKQFFGGSLQWEGLYPLFFHGWENIDLLRLDGHAFVDDRDLNFQDSKIRQNYGIQLSSINPIDGLSGRLFTGVEEGRNMLLFNVQGNENLRDCITEGVHKWTSLRYYRMAFTGGTTGSLISSKPPGMYSCSLRLLSLRQARLRGSIQSDWKYAGAFKDRGGVVYDNRTFTDFGTDGTEDHWVEDDTANYEVNELVGMALHQVDSGSGTKRRTIRSNTDIRIYYDGWIGDNTRDLDDLESGGQFLNYEIERNYNSDNRAFTGGLSFFDNYLTGNIPADVAPLHLVGSNFSLHYNLLQMKNIVDAVAPTEKRARMNWLIKDPRALKVSDTPLQGASSSGNVTYTYNGSSIVISLDASDSGDVQAQQIADAITADGSIELTCVYENDGKTHVFDSPLTGISNALKNITFEDTDGTGWTYQTQGYNFNYAPQGRLDERRYGVPNTVTVPLYFQDRTITATENGTGEIDFSDQAFAGNVYSWKRKLDGESEFTLMSGQTGNILTISDFGLDDQGEYILEIENPNAPDFEGDDVMRSGIVTLTL
jgi:hypothetical protein